MNRRRFLAASATVATAGLAGCSAVVSRLPGRAQELEWEYNAETFVGQGLQPTILVTGEIENVGNGFIPLVEVTCTVVATDGSTVVERTRRFRSLDPGEEQLMHYVFRVSGQEARAADDVQIGTRFPEQ